MKRILHILLIVGILAMNASAIEVRYKGSPPLNHKLITKRLNAEPNPTFLLLDSITTSLVNSAYLDAAIMIKDGSIIVSPGSRYLLTKLVFIADSTIEFAVNRPFDSVNTSVAIRQQLLRYHDAGFLYAVGQTEKVSINDSSVTLFVKINKGPQVKFGEPLIAGLTRTDDKVLKRYLPENHDGILTADYVSDLTKAAEQITFVKFTPPVAIQPRPGYTVSDLVLNFVEKKPVRFDGAAGITGSNENKPVWSFNLTLNNLFGQGKRAQIESERPDSKRNLLNVAYFQPLFLAGLGELNLSVQTRDYRDEFYEFAVGGGYYTRLNKNFVTGLDFEWKTSKPESTGSGYNRYSGKFSIARKTYTSDFNPESGLSLRWGIEFAFRRYVSGNLLMANQSQSLNETKNNLAVDLYQPVFGSLQLHSKVNYIGLETSEDLPPFSELILIGGPKTIRGYRDEQFSAVRTAFGTIEPRFRFSQGFISLFYDAAYLNNRVINNNNSIVTEEQFKWSYGLGFGLGNGRRNMALSLGINPEQGIGEPRLSIELSSDL